MKKIFALALALLMILSLAACGRSADSTMSVSAPAAAEEAAYDMAEEEVYWSDNGAIEKEKAAAGEPGEVPATQSAKMVYTANYEMETVEYDKSVEALTSLVESMGGYFENRSLNNYGNGYRYGNFTIRVPAEKYSAFCAAAGEQFHVNYFNENADNISESYYDTQSRLETAQIKLERLQTLLKQASSMDDIITIENAISDVEYTIESLSGTLKHYDSLVDYATVYIGLSEVYQLSDSVTAPTTFGEKLAQSFRDGFRSVGNFCQSIVMFVAYAWVYLAVVAVIVVAAVRVIRKRKAKKNTPAKTEE